MRKRVTKYGGLAFPAEMYANAYGSLAISAYILSAEKPDAKEIARRWRKAGKKGGITWGLDDADFIGKTLAYFGIERPADFPIAMVQSRTNVLFAPFVGGNVLPLREDGLAGLTLRTGKVYPIDFGGGDAA